MKSPELPVLQILGDSLQITPNIGSTSPPNNSGVYRVLVYDSAGQGNGSVDNQTGWRAANRGFRQSRACVSHYAAVPTRSVCRCARTRRVLSADGNRRFRKWSARTPSQRSLIRKRQESVPVHAVRYCECAVPRGLLFYALGNNSNVEGRHKPSPQHKAMLKPQPSTCSSVLYPFCHFR